MNDRRQKCPNRRGGASWAAVPLTAELMKADSGLCWAAACGPGDVITNQGGKLKLKTKAP
jgi:hypothetical protein